MVDTIVQQRDMYRILLAQADSSYSKPSILDNVASGAVDYASLLEETKEKDFAAFREQAVETERKSSDLLESVRAELADAKNARGARRKR